MRKIGLGKGHQESCCEYVKFKISIRHSNVRFLSGSWIYESGCQRRDQGQRYKFWRH